MAVILSESSLRKGQVSEAGAQGLMQLLPSVGRDLADRSGIEWQGQEPLFDPVVNIRLGTLHLFEQILKFRDFKKALVAYNMGEDVCADVWRKTSRCRGATFAKSGKNMSC